MNIQLNEFHGIGIHDTLSKKQVLLSIIHPEVVAFKRSYENLMQTMPSTIKLFITTHIY
jgi:hypothetical protein